MNDARPEFAEHAIARGRRRRLRRRIAAGLVLAAAIWFNTAFHLLDGRGSALVVGAVLTIACLRLIVVREVVGRTGQFTQALAAGRPTVPSSNRLSELERALDLATVSAGDAHHVLRPIVVDVAGTWLEATHGLGLDDRRAPALLPPPVWKLASPLAQRPEDPHDTGPSPSELSELISCLEALQ